MPDLAGPFDASTFAQAQYYRDRGHLEPSGVQGTPAATAAAGDLGLTAAGFALSLALGRGHVRGAAYERTGTAWTYTVPANTGTVGPRNDLLVLRRDLTAKTVVPTYLQGTAAATPADPAVTQVEDGVWDEPLFRVQAPISSGTPLVVTDLRKWISGALQRVQRLALIGAPWTHYPDTGGAGEEPVYLSAVGFEARCRGLMRVTGSVAVGETYTIVAAGGIPTAMRPTSGALRSAMCLGATMLPERIDIGSDGSMRIGPFGRAYTSPWLASFDVSWHVANLPTA